MGQVHTHRERAVARGLGQQGGKLLLYTIRKSYTGCSADSETHKQEI